jgi:hypothetical protein
VLLKISRLEYTVLLLFRANVATAPRLAGKATHMRTTQEEKKKKKTRTAEVGRRGRVFLHVIHFYYLK